MRLTHEYNLYKNDILSRLGTSSDFETPCVFEIRAVFRREGQPGRIHGIRSAPGSPGAG